MFLNKSSELVELVESPFCFNTIDDKLGLACKNANHPLSVAALFVPLNYFIMENKKLNPFDLNRTEYAELLGITPNAVRMRMRHGKLKEDYKFENGKYIFKAPQRERVNYGQTTGHLTTPKKIYNRGNHYKANYPNEAFRLHNERKMLNAVNERDPNFINNYQEIKAKYTQDKAKEKIEQQRQQQRSSVRKYGSPIFSESNKGYDDLRYHNGRADESQPDKFRATNRGKNINWEKKYY